MNRGLTYIRDAGESWITKRGCVSCHQVPSTLWAHEAALRSSFPVSSEKLDETQATTSLWTILALSIEATPFDRKAAVEFADRVSESK